MYLRIASWTVRRLALMLCVVCPMKGRGLRALLAACHIRLTEEEDWESVAILAQGIEIVVVEGEKSQGQANLTIPVRE